MSLFDKKDKFTTEWLDKIKSGEEFRQKYSTYDKWDEYTKQYRNQWKPGILAVNKIYSYGRMMIPRVYFNNPKITVTASHPDFVTHARVVEEIDNILIKQTNLKKTIKKAITQAYLKGIAPIKLGFDSEFGFIPDQALGTDGETVTQVDKKDGTKIEYNESVREGMPWALCVDPKDIIVPWGTKGYDDIPWIAHKIIRPLKDIQNDQKYTNTKDLKGTRSEANKDRAASFRPSFLNDKETMYGEIWEVRDFKTGKIYAFCEQKQILGLNDALQLDGLPYEFLTFNDDPELFWAIPDADILQQQQEELNEITTQTQKHRRIALCKFLYKEGAISAEQLENFMSGEIGVGVGIKDVENLQAAIFQFQPHIPPDFYQAAMAVIGAMKEELGFNSNDLGEFQQGSPKSASEVMSVSNASDQRVSERRDIVSDLVARIVRKWNQYLFTYWTAEKVIKLTGPPIDGKEWVSYTGEALKGEYYINVDTDSGMPITKALKYQMGQDMLGKFNGDPMIDQILLRQIVLDTYTTVDPRASRLLAIPPGMDPRMAAAARQPMPEGAGGGKGSSGGREGGGSEFNAGQARFNETKGAQ